MRILILAGTTEARELASRLAKRPDIEAIASLAGQTVNPLPYKVKTRVGGFGGASGLTHYLHENRIDLLVDATHPFAEQISRHANTASTSAQIPHITLCRKPWEKNTRNWIEFPSLDAALMALPTDARTFVATGKKSAPLVEKYGDKTLFLRAITALADPFPNRTGGYIIGQPPFSEAAEMAQFKKLEITHLICKNSGGSQSSAKLTIADRLGLNIHMINRPVNTGAHPVAETIDQAMELINTLSIVKKF